MMRGFNLFKMDGNVYDSYEFPRESLSAVFALNVIALEGTPTVTISVAQRDFTGTGWTVAGTYSDITTTGVKTLEISGLQQMLKYGRAGSP